MTLEWVIAGTVAQLGYASYIFMVVAFTAAGIGNCSKLTRTQNIILMMSLYGLPLSALLAAAAVGLLFYHGEQSRQYYWIYVLPIVLGLAYIVYVVRLSNRSSSKTARPRVDLR